MRELTPEQMERNQRRFDALPDPRKEAGGKTREDTGAKESGKNPDEVSLSGGIKIKKDETFTAASTGSAKIIFDFLISKYPPKAAEEDEEIFKFKDGGKQLRFYSDAQEKYVPVSIDDLNAQIELGAEREASRKKKREKIENLGEIKDGKIELTPGKEYKGGAVAEQLFKLTESDPAMRNSGIWSTITWKVDDVSFDDKEISVSATSKDGKKLLSRKFKHEEIVGSLGATGEFLQKQEAPFAQAATENGETRIRPGLVIFEAVPKPAGSKQDDPAPDPIRHVVKTIYKREDGAQYASFEDGTIMPLDQLEKALANKKFALEPSAFEKTQSALAASIKKHEAEEGKIKEAIDKNGTYNPDAANEQSFPLGNLSGKIASIVRKEIESMAPAYKIKIDSCDIKMDKDGQLTFSIPAKVKGGGSLGRIFDRLLDAKDREGELMTIKGTFVIDSMGRISQGAPITVEGENLGEIKNLVLHKGLPELVGNLRTRLQMDAGGRPIEAVRIKNGTLTALLAEEGQKGFRPTATIVEDPKVKGFLSDAQHSGKKDQLEKVVALEKEVQAILDARKAEIERLEAEAGNDTNADAVKEAREFEKNPLETIDAQLRKEIDATSDEAQKADLQRQLINLLTYANNKDKPMEDWTFTSEYIAPPVALPNVPPPPEAPDDFDDEPIIPPAETVEATKTAETLQTIDLAWFDAKTSEASDALAALEDEEETLGDSPSDKERKTEIENEKKLLNKEFDLYNELQNNVWLGENNRPDILAQKKLLEKMGVEMERTEKAMKDIEFELDLASSSGDLPKTKRQAHATKTLEEKKQKLSEQNMHDLLTSIPSIGKRFSVFDSSDDILKSLELSAKDGNKDAKKAFDAAKKILGDGYMDEEKQKLLDKKRSETDKQMKKASKKKK